MTAATAALIWVGTPKIPRAAPIPANSATVEPRFAASIRTAANAPQRTPQRSRMRPISPLPGRQPEPGPDLLGEEQDDLAREDDPEQLVAELRADDGVRRDAAGVVVGEAADEPRPEDGEGREEPDSPDRQVGERREDPRSRPTAARGRAGDRAGHAAGPHERVRDPEVDVVSGSSGARRRRRGIDRPPYRLNTRGRRFFQAVGMTVSMASSTVTMPTSRSSPSTTGTASRL